MSVSLCARTRARLSLSFFLDDKKKLQNFPLKIRFFFEFLLPVQVIWQFRSVFGVRTGNPGQRACDARWRSRAGRRTWRRRRTERDPSTIKRRRLPRQVFCVHEMPDAADARRPVRAHRRQLALRAGLPQNDEEQQ